MENEALFKLSYGLYVTGVKTENGFGGSCVDSIAQISHGDPPRVAFGSMNQNFTTESIRKSGEFTLSVLGQDVDPLVIANFGFQSARDPAVSKWNNVNNTLMDGIPVLDGAIAQIKLSVEEIILYDTHTLFLAAVKSAKFGESDAKPLLYSEYLAGWKDKVFAAFGQYKKDRADQT
ncbi:MAG: flavin reductase family protein [Clostridiales Family XIII bacterium]|jgi:flavin reductase (DIM6/NTAB) family NADH-FMN oxidoreductase RutF|nr:flavin reductase family protein [Clostridiales Family XIII bacterium]